VVADVDPHSCGKTTEAGALSDVLGSGASA
jgi:hypothetical protein